MVNIKDLFVQLTSETYPNGHEVEVEKFLPHGYSKDSHGNCYLKIGNTNTIFASHMDTQSRVKSSIKHIFDGNYIMSDGTTILGADDKAGMVCMLKLIENNIPGLYCFFIGEERGCIGSKAASKDVDFFKGYNKVVSFDRRGTTSVITHQSYTRTCSDEFALELSKQLNKNGMEFSPDNTGVCTDSLQFRHIIPECTNISVGYYNEHTNSEKQDIDHLEKLIDVLLTVDWDNLPAVRDCSVVEELETIYTKRNKTRNTREKTPNTNNYSHNNSYNRKNKKANKKERPHYNIDHYIPHMKNIFSKLTDDEINYINTL